MARNTEAGAALTRRLVIDAAIGVFSERGVRDATLEDVAARAGVTRGAVYGHFAGKPALVATIMEDFRWPLDISDDLAAYLTHQQPLRRLQSQLQMQMARCRQDPIQWPVVTLVLRESGCATWPRAAINRTAQLQAKAIASLGKVMEVAKEGRQLRADVAPDLAARCLHVVAVGILSDHTSKLAGGVRIDTSRCLQLFFEGLASPQSSRLSRAA